jgi:hypothetical protein
MPQHARPAEVHRQLMKNPASRRATASDEDRQQTHRRLNMNYRILAVALAFLSTPAAAATFNVMPNPVGGNVTLVSGDGRLDGQSRFPDGSGLCNIPIRIDLWNTGRPLRCD